MVCKQKLIKFLSILICLIPVSLVISIVVSEILVFLIGLIYLSYIFYYKDLNLKKNFFLRIFLIIYGFLIINSFFSEDFFLTLKVTLPYIRYCLLTLAICLIYENNIDLKKYLKIFFLPVIFFLVIDGYIQFFFSKNIIGYSTNSLRLSSFFFDEWILGSYIQKFLPVIFMVLFFKSQSTLKTFVNLILVLSILILIYLTGERTGFYLSFMYLILVSYFLGVIFIPRNIFIYFLITIILISIFYILPIKDRVFLTSENTNFFYEFINFYNETYKYFHMTSLNIFKSYEVIGSGVKTFRILCEKYYFIDQIKSCSTHPHNYYFQILAETGLLGFIILSSIFLFFVFKYISLYLYSKKILSENLDAIFAISGMVIYLFPFATSGNFFNNFISIIFFFNMGFVIKNLNRLKHQLV